MGIRLLLKSGSPATVTSAARERKVPVFVDPKPSHPEICRDATCITPNLREASVLVGRELRTVEDMMSAARQLSETGARHVVVKGGHLPGRSAVDVISDGVETKVLSVPRIETANVHGTGCTLSAAVAAYLALESSPVEAIERAKAFLTRALRGAAGWTLGSGQGPVDALGWAADVSDGPVVESL